MEFLSNHSTHASAWFFQKISIEGLPLHIHIKPFLPSSKILYAYNDMHYLNKSNLFIDISFPDQRNKQFVSVSFFYLMYWEHTKPDF